MCASPMVMCNNLGFLDVSLATTNNNSEEEAILNGKPRKQSCDLL